MAEGKATSYASTPPWPRSAQAGLFLVPALVSWWLCRRQPALLIDDAYITFRYAENLARGAGLVFNPGERVLGTTAPLWAAVLAAAKLLGFDTPTAALLLGQVFTASVCGLLALIQIRRLPAPLALISSLVLALHPDLIFFAGSGMETGFYMFLVLATLGAAFQRYFFLSGLLSAAAFLTRPDGALLFLVGAIMAGGQGRKELFRFAAAGLAVTLPWLVFATWFYGSPIPHSIAAKQLIHPTGLSPLAHGYLFLFLPVWPMQILAFLALPSGVLALIRRTELWPLAGWTALYLAGLVFSRIAPIFPWYLVPLLPLMIFFDAVSVKSLIYSRALLRPKRRQTALVLFGLCLFFGLGLWLYHWRGLYFQRNRMQFERARDYLAIGEWLATQAKPGDRVMAGEVGALSFALLDFNVLDSAGIASPEIFRLRRADQERQLRAGRPGDSAQWVKEAVDRFQPRWIVSKARFLHLEELAGDLEFRSRYLQVTPPFPTPPDYFVLKRREER